jgi:hypothetical protein
LGAYAEARRRFPNEALLPYAGQYVAFSADASRIVAHAHNLEALFGALAADGISLGQVVWEYVPGPNEEIWL